MRSICLVTACVLLPGCWCGVQAQSAPPPASGTAQAATPAAEPSHPTIALAPAVVMLRGRPGQSATQTLTISNQLPFEMRFDIEVQDVVVRDGKRVFVPAGQIPSSVAASVVAAPSSVVAPAGQTASANITLTAPASTAQRAIVVFFKSKLPAAGQEKVGFGASLGALITLNLSDDVKVASGPMTTTPQTASANVSLSAELENIGAEPVIPKGVVAILDAGGKRVAKAAFDSHRLLPGERAIFKVASPAFLAPGRYRAMSSFEYEGKVLTNVGDFTVSD